MYFSFFAAPVFGVVGIINDRRKFFAIAMNSAGTEGL